MSSGNIRYGATIRKRKRAVTQQKIALYKCESCGKNSVERISTAIWRCRHCGKIYAGGAYTFTTAMGAISKHSLDSVGKSQRTAVQDSSKQV
ncbi:50S ribosomal protein L37ae [Candidatus Mancarchaeum acidiphilum]|uniref:50S ribosomal protein L37Ae n=1 Tax=Candidatus Mancarchaeum acidiphilum TaxID=1920749 RepID=A0A218NLQ7_9ARCH|nr:50S ribosomal protein L37ae [Candidatus Mancarchaeum acidiphilum]ASI13396.1 50S ribosomal protein L37ae [Candidatus Mancarchaeum acidiphilum]